MRQDNTTISTTLRDGTPVLVRQVRPEDKKFLELGMSRLSSETRYYRFHTAKPALTRAELEAFTEIDHVNHDAWGAVDVSGDVPQPAGVARYVRLPGDDNAADVAITVVDDYQGRGLGSILLGVIASRAAENGIERFRSCEVWGNQRLFDLIAGLDATQHFLGAGEVEVDFPLHRDASLYPDTVAGHIMRRGERLLTESRTAG